MSDDERNYIMQNAMAITLIKPPNSGNANLAGPAERKIEVDWNQLPEEITESLVVELYRNYLITFNQAQILLNHTSWKETAGILEAHNCELYYDQDDFNNDQEIVARIIQQKGNEIV